MQNQRECLVTGGSDGLLPVMLVSMVFCDDHQNTQEIIHMLLSFSLLNGRQVGHITLAREIPLQSVSCFSL